MSIETAHSWRELDDAIANPAIGRHEHRVHSTLVFRGLPLAVGNGGLPAARLRLLLLPAV